MSFIPEAASIVLTRLNKSHEAYLVGGFVRDWLLGRNCYDFDITTSALPEQVRTLFSDYPVLDTGLKHGTVTVIIQHQPVEITTYRIEGQYLDHRHPSEIKFSSSLEEDLKRRDFTINALCLTQNGTIIDHHNGINDLNHRIIRSIGNPIERFNEDALRILRAIRFRAQLNFSIEPTTHSALFACSENLRTVAIERIMKEFEMILLSDQVAGIIEEFHQIFYIFLPELKTLRQHASLWQRMINRLSICPSSLALRLSCIFAEIGVIQVEDPSAMISSSCFLNVAKRLKLSNALTARCSFLIQNQDAKISADRINIKKRLNRWNDSFFELLSWHEVLGKAPDEIEMMKNITQEIISSGECFTLKQLEINGNDVQNAGYQGYEIRIILEKLLDLVIEEKILNKREDLLAYLLQLNKNHFRSI